MARKSKTTKKKITSTNGFQKKPKTSRRKPKTPPCNQYGPDNILYQRNGKKFCRKVTKLPKNIAVLFGRKIKSSKKVKKFICDNSAAKTINYGKLMNIDTHKYNGNEICNKIMKISEMGEPNMSDVKKVAQIIKVNIRNKTKKEVLEGINVKLLKNGSVTYKKIIEIINTNMKNKLDLGSVHVNLIMKILYPNSFPLESPIPVSSETYNNLINKRKNGTISSDENLLLEQSLHIKLCHCIKKMFLQSKFQKDVLGINSEYNSKKNPYALCTHSVYKQRNMQPLSKAAIKCRDTFRWYRKNDLNKTRKQKGSGETTQGCSSCPANNPTMSELAWDERFTYGKDCASGSHANKELSGGCGACSPNIPSNPILS
tara:strand:- start:127 stop:1239 length:1113 start_codon:yes stop_codon:yes gene_type:complete